MTCIIGAIISCMAIGSPMMAPILGCVGSAGSCATSPPAASAPTHSSDMRFMVRSPGIAVNDNDNEAAALAGCRRGGELTSPMYAAARAETEPGERCEARDPMDPRRTRHRGRAGAGTTTTGLLPGRHRRLATPDRAVVGRELFDRYRTPRRGGGHPHPLWLPGVAPEHAPARRSRVCNECLR